MLDGVFFQGKQTVDVRRIFRLRYRHIFGFTALRVYLCRTFPDRQLKNSDFKTSGAAFICLLFLFVFKEERFSLNKILGALIGFCGIVSINAGASFKGFALGDTLIISASVCTVISMIISGKAAKGTSPLWITGISQLFGGSVLLIISLAMGGKVYRATVKLILVFAYICIASIIGYTLFYYVQRTAELSRLFIIKFAEPLFACVFSAFLLGENIMKMQYLIAFILISVGIVIANTQKSNKHI